MGKLRIAAQYLRTAFGGDFDSREELLAWQDRQVRAHIAAVREESPFYARLYDGLPIETWRSFPAINKRVMMENFSALNTVGIDRDDAFAVAAQAELTRHFTPQLNGVTIGLSSGTSGNRGLFLVDERERDRWAGYVLAKVLPYSLLRKQSVAFFLRANSNLYRGVASSRIAFSYYDLTRPFDGLVRQLQGQQPDLIVAPPSVLSLLAAEQDAGRISLRPARVVSVADVLEDQERERIGAAFSTTVHQVYQATEGLLGMTCAQGTMHLNEDILAIQERSLGNGRFSPTITDFTRMTQPIIRYDLDDILVERSEPCPCGSVFRAIASIEGRCDQAIRVPGHPDSVIFPDFVRRAIITASPAVQEYRFTYRGPTADVELQFDPDVLPGSRAGIERDIGDSLRAVFADRGLPAPSFTFSSLAADALAQKRRRVRNLVGGA